MPTAGKMLLASGKVKAAPPPTIAELLPTHRYRASQAVGSPNITSIPNEGTAGGQLDVQAGTIAAPTADATLNNASSANFTGTQALISSLPASAFNFLHNGAGATVYYVGVVGAVQSMFTGSGDASAANVGMRLGHSAANVFCGVSNGAVITQSIYSITNTAGTAIAVRAVLNATQIATAKNGTVGNTLAYGFTPSTSSPLTPYIVGRSGPAGAFGQGRFAELLIFNRVLTAGELAVVAAEYTALYGLAG